MVSEESCGRSVICEIDHCSIQDSWVCQPQRCPFGVEAPAPLSQHPSIQGPQTLFTLLTPAGIWSKPHLAKPRPLQSNCRVQGTATALTERCLGNSPTAATPGAVFNRELPFPSKCHSTLWSSRSPTLFSWAFSLLPGHTCLQDLAGSRDCPALGCSGGWQPLCTWSSHLTYLPWAEAQPKALFLPQSHSILGKKDAEGPFKRACTVISRL